MSFTVGTDCPYYDDGYTVADLQYGSDGNVETIFGPWNVPYTYMGSQTTGGNYNNYDSNNQDDYNNEDEEVNIKIQNADGSYKTADNINDLI